MAKTYEPIIGLEIHVQLATASKMFCACSNQGETAPPNTTVCPICLGHPGALPVANKQAIKFATQTALALRGQVNQRSKFDRKHYFYPDLPKGYQISQYDEPLSKDGYVVAEADGEEFRIRLERLHLEEDAAKNFHVKDQTLVDFNRAGSPLMEIVTKPDFRTPAQAKTFLQVLRLLLRYLGVSDGDMEKGHLRCDVNISLRPVGDTKLYPKTEIKNLNSFRSVERALRHEIKEQTKLWEENNPPKSLRTLGWREDEGQTVVQRIKEEAMDYRYFPEPDLPPLVISDEELKEWQAELPELPHDKYHRFVTEYQLTPSAAKQLVEDRDLADYFEHGYSELLRLLAEGEETEELVKTVSKTTYSWLTSELLKLTNAGGLPSVKAGKVTPSNFGLFLSFIARRQVNSTNGQVLLKEMFETGDDPESILASRDLKLKSDWDLDKLAVEAINSHLAEAAAYKAGKTALLQYFVGLVMKETKGQADPQAIREALERQLND